jgi:hypothetical protein
MTTEKNYKQPFAKTWEDSFFACIANRIVCLLCGFEPTCVKKYVIHRHYECKHSKEYSVYVGHEKSALIAALQLVYQQRFDAMSEVCDNEHIQDKTIRASYAISHLIAKHSRPFTDGVFIKDCIRAAVKAFGNTVTSEDINNIALSRDTVRSRIIIIACFIEEKLKSLLATCTYFSLCLDESTDVRHVSQLSIFARIVQDDFSCTEEILDFVPLHDTTTGIDIYRALETTLTKFCCDFSKCSCIVTDGAKSMVGSKIGLLGQLKQRNLKFPLLHCIIHQEALCGKNIKLSTAMQTVITIVNTIKGGNKFLLHRKFQSFLEEYDATYKDVPLYCEVRWLSAGKTLQKFFAVRKEIYTFIQEMCIAKLDTFQSFFEDVESLCELAIITDLTCHLNTLNLKLQQNNQTIFELLCHVDSFRAKLKVFLNHLERNSFFFFPSCSILNEEHGTKCDFKKYAYFINSLIAQFDKRFRDFEILRKDLILFENPRTVPIIEQNVNFQSELCDLQSDISLKSRPETGVTFLKILNKAKYPQLRNFGLKIFSMFGSTYLCELSFSKMKHIKCGTRSNLNDMSLSSLMRVNLSKIDVNVSHLQTKK